MWTLFLATTFAADIKINTSDPDTKVMLDSLLASELTLDDEMFTECTTLDPAPMGKPMGATVKTIADASRFATVDKGPAMNWFIKLQSDERIVLLETKIDIDKLSSVKCHVEQGMPEGTCTFAYDDGKRQGKGCIAGSIDICEPENVGKAAKGEVSDLAFGDAADCVFIGYACKKGKIKTECDK